jgi:hypothetical protein
MANVAGELFLSLQVSPHHSYTWISLVLAALSSFLLVEEGRVAAVVSWVLKDLYLDGFLSLMKGKWSVKNIFR